MLGAARASLVLAAISVWVGICYTSPGTFLARPAADPSLAGQSSVVVAIESWGPVWPVVFLLAGAALALAVWRRRFIGYALSLGAGAWGFYGSALVTSAVLYEPPRSVLTGGVAIGAAFLHLALIRVWTDQGVK
jgi:hypothetical protein